MLSSLSLLALLSPLTVAPAQADEGMWLPEQLPEHAQRLEELGLELPVDQLADPEGAVLGSIVSLGFCSASFVNPEGLLLTNHHCVGGYLQVNSTADANRARDGYLAGSRAEELSAGPGARITIVSSLTDVTDQVNVGIKKRTKDADRERRIAENKKALVATCEAKADTRCRVAGYYGGSTYRLIEARELRDVRIVYAPPESVGSYGGDIDNWEWPRHSGDFAVLRAYTAPDGSTAEYSEDNIPYQPPHHLTLATDGIDEGDLVMVAGFPGRTDRYALARKLRHSRDVSYPWGISQSDAVLEILHDESSKSPEAAARLAAPIDWVGNGLKYRQGMLDNFTKSGVVQRVEAREAELEAWVNADRKRLKTIGAALDELDTLSAEEENRWEVDTLHSRLVGYIDPLMVATTAVRLAQERQKPDLQRESGFQARDEDRIKARFERLEKSQWLGADQRLMALYLSQHTALPADRHIKPLDAWLTANGGVDAALSMLFDEPALGTVEGRLALLDADLAGLKASDDPWVKLALVMEAWRAPRRAQDKLRTGARLRLMPTYMSALLDSHDGPVYPNANGSLRVTFGEVAGYSPRDGVWNLPHTTATGMAAKAGDAPFDAPDRLIDAVPTARDSRWSDPDLGDVPANFLTSLDTTGGNSGSATLDGQGRLVGLIFDGNYEAMSADWLFDPVLTRSIHVDVRYMLWVLEVEGANHLLEELGAAPR